MSSFTATAQMENFQFWPKIRNEKWNEMDAFPCILYTSVCLWSSPLMQSHFIVFTEHFSIFFHLNLSLSLSLRLVGYNSCFWQKVIKVETRKTAENHSLSKTSATMGQRREGSQTECCVQPQKAIDMLYVGFGFIGRMLWVWVSTRLFRSYSLCGRYIRCCYARYTSHTNWSI